MKSLANNWLEFAHKDLQAASQIVSNAELTALTAFHCEQCIEKSFKAILASYEKPPPRTHDLVTLHTQVEELISFPVNEATLREVSDTYTESRYPLSEMSPAEQSPSSDKVQIFLSQAREIYDSARSTIGR